MGSTEGKTCEQRIDEQLKGRLEEMFPDPEDWSTLECARHLRRRGIEILSADVNELREQIRETAREQALEGVLSIEKTTTFRLCLSWGGPADYFELDWSPTSEAWTGGRYLFQDWGDGATRTLPEETIEQLADLFGITPKTE